MKQEANKIESRNWALVFIASIYMLVGLVLVVIASLNILTFGWWSLALGLAGLLPIITSAISIIRSDPSVILADLILRS